MFCILLCILVFFVYLHVYVFCVHLCVLLCILVYFCVFLDNGLVFVQLVAKTITSLCVISSLVPVPTF